MKVLLINISLRPQSPQLLFPIGLGYIASAIHRTNHELEILDIDAYRYSDEEIEKFIKKKTYDVVAFGCIVTGYKIVKRLATIIKKHKDVPIICGNSVASSIPHLLLSKTQVDIVVIGEGDITIVEVLNALDSDISLYEVDGIAFKEDHRIVVTPPRQIISKLDIIPPIDWALFDMDTYISKSKIRCNKPYPISYDSIRAMPINMARGCPYRCSFCYHVFVNDKYRVRSPESVCREIKDLKRKYGINYIWFVDELSFYSIKQCKNFINIILEENLEIFWNANCRSDLFREKDFNLILKMKQAGCAGLSYSLESANPGILKAMNKKIIPSQFSIQTRILHEAGIPTWTSLVMGYPQESEETITETFNYCCENNIYPSVGYIQPQPGTPIYEYAKRLGKIRDEESYLLSMGDRQDFSMNFTQMEQSKIEDLVKQHLRKIADKLHLKLKDRNLIKTGVYRGKKCN